MGGQRTRKVRGDKRRNRLEKRLRDFNAETDFPFDFEAACFEVSVKCYNFVVGE